MKTARRKSWLSATIRHRFPGKLGAMLWLFVVGVLVLAAVRTAAAQNSGFSGGALTSTLGNLANGLGGSSADLQKAQAAARNGLNDQEMDQACQGAIAKHMSTADVESLGKTLGLSSAQASQLSDCVARGGPTQNSNPAPQLMPQNTQQIPSRQTETSSIEGRFHELDTPYKLFTAPTAVRSNSSATIFFRAGFRPLLRPATFPSATTTSLVLTTS